MSVVVGIVVPDVFVVIGIFSVDPVLVVVEGSVGSDPCRLNVGELMKRMLSARLVRMALVQMLEESLILHVVRIGNDHPLVLAVLLLTVRLLHSAHLNVTTEP